jgi:hypothetical protein
MIELLDHVLDKGIVFDSSVRVSGPGIELLALEVVVVSTTVYTTYASLPISAVRSRAIASDPDT